MTGAEIRQQLLGYLPPGLAAKLGPDLLGIIDGIAATLKTKCADLVDTLRREAVPQTCVQLLPDWESVFAMTETAISRFGTTTARQSQLVAALRTHSSLSIPDLRALMQPFFLYADPTQIQVLEADRAALKAAHTYASNTTNVNIGLGPFGGTTTFTVNDDGPVSEAGAQLVVEISGYLDELSFTLTGPDGSSQMAHWPAGYIGGGQVLNESYILYAPTSMQFTNGPLRTTVAGRVGKTWGLLVHTKGPHTGTLHSASLFVEAVGRNSMGGEGLGCAVHEFAVVADPALLGSGHDLDAANKLLQRVKPGWARAAVVKKNAVGGGGLLAIPDEPTTLPDASIPG